LRHSEENVAIAMQCNLRPPNDVQVILRFNYDQITTLIPRFKSVNPICCCLIPFLLLPNLSANKQSVAELLRFQYLT